MAGMPGEFHTLVSADSIADDDPKNPLLQNPNHAAAVNSERTLVLPEELELLTPPGLPDHDLILKVGAIAILIRNLDVRAGLVNGTRLRILDISRCKVRAKVLTGNDIIRGQVIDLMRIEFEGAISQVLKMKRVQFPLRAAFAMTINKSQGQTLEKVSIAQVLQC